MAQEIKITDYELEKCNGNLKSLSSTWAAVPKVSGKTVGTSRGHSAEQLITCLDMTKQISKSMQQLLDNSVMFFEELGISFQDSDASAARNIETLTK